MRIRRKVVRRWVIGLGLIGVIGLGATAALRAYTAVRAHGQIYTLDNVPERPVAIVFGAQVYPSGKPSAMLADRVAIMRRGRLMHVEDMHERRRNQRLVLVRFEGPPPATMPEHLDLSVRERNGEVLLLEHRGAAGPLLGWLASQPVADLAIGTEDLRTLYDRYHGPNAEPDPEDR